MCYPLIFSCLFGCNFFYSGFGILEDLLYTCCIYSFKKKFKYVKLFPRHNTFRLMECDDYHGGKYIFMTEEWWSDHLRCSSIFGRSRQQTVPSLVRASLRLPPRLHFHFSKYLIKILEFTGCPKKTHFQNAAAGPTVHWLNHQWPTPLVSGNRFIGRFSLKLSLIKPSKVMYMVKNWPTVLNFNYDFTEYVNDKF